MQARILAPTPDNLLAAAKLLKNGGLAGMPTETVYGLAARVFDPGALASVFAVKERPTFDPLIVHLAPEAEATPLEVLERSLLIDFSKLSAAAREELSRLVTQFWPGPLTIVLPKSADVPDLATSGLPTVAVRMPSHPIAQQLITAVGEPLAAPSANRFGRISPTTAAHVLEELGDRIEIILDGGPCQIGLESTVISLGPTGGVRVLRPGKITAEELQTVVTTPVLRGAPAIDKGFASPGMLLSHYAPAKPLRLLPSPLDTLADSELARILKGTTPGILLFRGERQSAERRLAALDMPGAKLGVLSPSGDLAEAARSLFSELRGLDASEADVLFAEPCPVSTGLGYAIMDRLQRASAPRSHAGNP